MRFNTGLIGVTKCSGPYTISCIVSVIGDGATLQISVFDSSNALMKLLLPTFTSPQITNIKGSCILLRRSLIVWASSLWLISLVRYCRSFAMSSNITFSALRSILINEDICEIFL
jgi:hypothetical protein